MRIREIVSHKRHLDALFDKVRDLPDDMELKAHWARYLCVLVSGFLENSVRAIYREYTHKQAAPNIVNYVHAKLQGFQNPTPDNLYVLARSFCPEWESALKDTTDNEMKSAVGSVVSLRHKIAHGESVDLTYLRVKEYYKHVVRLIDFLETQCSM